MNDATNTAAAADLADPAAANSETETPAAQVSGKEYKYFFKTPVIKDATGKEIGKGPKHPDVKVLIPTASIAEIVAYLQAPDDTPESRVRDMIVDSLFDVQMLAGRKQINEFLEKNPDKQFAATDMDLSKLSLQIIADTPKGQRGAWAPDEEDFKAFVESYTDVLVHKTDYAPDRTATHCLHWKSGLAKVKNDKPVIAKLKDFLTIYAANVSEDDMEENAQTYAWLLARANKYLAAEEKDFMKGL